MIVAAKTTFGQVGKMVVSGRVLNADKHPDKKVVQLQFRDLLRDEGTKSTVELDAEGRFRLEAQLPFAQDMYLDYGNLKTLFCRPGDSLYLELDADNPKIIRTFKGRSAAINVHIQAFLQGLPTQKFQGQSLIDAQKKLDETGYIQFLEARRTVYSDYLNGFLRANKTDVDFRRWANQYIEFGVYEDRLRYRWTHPHYNGMNKDSFQLSSGYYSFLQKAMQDDYDLVTLQQESFMGEVFNYSMQVTPDQMRVITQLAEDGKTADAVRIQLENLQRKSTGLTREILLTRYYLLLLRSLQLNVFDAVFTKESVRHPYLLNEIQTARVQLQTYLLNKETKGASLESFKTNTTVGLIDSIAAGCNGKVVYIDFWAPWCTPCMDEMPHSKALQEYYKEKDVVFIYLAVSCSDEAWRATIANKKLGGRHFLLTDDQYKVLSAQFGIAGIPHYVMIDKKGNIAQKYAPRPSEREILLRTVDELLNN